MTLIFSFWKECVTLAKIKLAGTQISFKRYIQANPIVIRLTFQSSISFWGTCLTMLVDAVTEINSPEIDLAALWCRSLEFVVQILGIGRGYPAEILRKSGHLFYYLLTEAVS
jgi:hypothetical protein